MNPRTRMRMLAPQGRGDWYRIKASDKGPAEIHIYDEIGFFGVSASDFIRDLADIKGAVDIHLNSPGGEVFDGLAIYEALKQRTTPVSVKIDSLAASIASVIAMAADPGRLLIARTASMMIHNAWGMGVGDAADLRKLADMLTAETDNVASIYAERSGKPASYFSGLMTAETWLKGQQAVDEGLADGILKYPAKDAPPADSFDLSVFNQAPDFEPAPETVREDVFASWDASMVRDALKGVNR